MGPRSSGSDWGSRFERLELATALLCALLAPAALTAQDDTTSLGDIARNLRRDKAQQEMKQEQPAPPAIIDNDNLGQALEDVRRVKSAEKIIFSADGSGNSFRFSSPDVSCSLAFNAHGHSFLFQPVLIEDLPLAELLKLDGPASIQDDTLQLEVLNGTEWELREITVGVTLERKVGQNAELAARARVIPAAENSAAATVERRSDMTLLFHLKANAKPFTSTIFRESIGITPSADEDWRWSIVEAKGIRPGQGPNLTETLPGLPPLGVFSPAASAEIDVSAVPASSSLTEDAGRPATTLPASPPR
jgi:hypothetical protein